MRKTDAFSMEIIVAGEGIDLYKIDQMEKELLLNFSLDYREYLQEFGYAIINGHELTGSGPDDSIDVVRITKEERKRNPMVPKTWYVIEQMNIDYIVVWQDKDGMVYQTNERDEPVKICDSLVEYLLKF